MVTLSLLSPRNGQVGSLTGLHYVHTCSCSTLIDKERITAQDDMKTLLLCAPSAMLSDGYCRASTGMCFGLTDELGR
jgi:hypothetical protein